MDGRVDSLTRRELLRTAAFGIGGSFVLANCVATQTAPAAIPSPSSQPKRGGTIQLAVPASPANFDSQLSLTANVNAITNLSMQNLVRFKPLLITAEGTADPSSSDVEGELASKWSNPSPTVWMFTIADGARWHDIPPVSGRIVTADDVVATFQRILDEKANSALFKYYAPFVQSVTAIDQSTVRFDLKTPYAVLPHVLATGYTQIYPREAVTAKYDPKTALIGSGPFQLDGFDRDRSYRFKRNPNYWKAGLPYLDGVTVLVIPDPNALVTAITTKQLDISNITGASLAAVKASNPTTRSSTHISFGSYGLHLNPRAKNAPFNDARVRQAVKYAVDQDEIVSRAWGGDASFTGITAPISGKWALPLSENKKLWAPDLAKAKQLLTAAGYATGFDTEINFDNTKPQRPDSQIAQVLASQLAKVGIRAQLSGRDTVSHNKLLFAWDHHGLVLNGQGVFLGDDPQSWLYDRFSVNGGFNWAQPPDAADSKLQSMLNQQYQIADEGQRRTFCQDLERYIADLAIWVGVGLGNDNVVWQGDIQGWSQRTTVSAQSVLESTWRST